jgi:hypothetical protein
MEAKNVLCNNLSAIDLKMFLIDVQQQLDGLFLVITAPTIANITTDVLRVRILMN